VLASIPPGIDDHRGALRRISNRVLSCGLYRGPRQLLRNKAVCKDAVCSFVQRRNRSHQLTNLPCLAQPDHPNQYRLTPSGKSLQTE
jgi:hypothetical protein